MYTDYTEFPSDDELSYIDGYGESFHILSATYTYCSDEVKSLPVWSEGLDLNNSTSAFHFFFTNPVYLKQKQETVMSIISLA
ncbi:hypothetical protein HF086_001046, partial [Spodoptera exigua]